MNGRNIRWFLIGVGIVIAAGVAGWIVTASRRSQFAVDETDTGAPATVDAPDWQPVP